MDIEAQQPKKDKKVKKKKKKRKKDKAKKEDEVVSATGLGALAIYAIVVSSILVLLVGGYVGFFYIRSMRHKLHSARQEFLDEVNECRKNVSAYIEKLKTEYPKKPYKLDTEEPVVCVAEMNDDYGNAGPSPLPPGRHAAAIAALCPSFTPLAPSSAKRDTNYAGGNAHRIKLVKDKIDEKIDEVNKIVYNFLTAYDVLETDKMTFQETRNPAATLCYSIRVYGCSNAKATVAAIMLAPTKLPMMSGFKGSPANQAGIDNPFELPLLGKGIKYLESFSYETVKVGDQSTKLWTIVVSSG